MTAFVAVGVVTFSAALGALCARAIERAADRTWRREK